MKRTISPAKLPLLVLGCGALGLLLRIWLYGTGIDDRGLLVRWHPAGILLTLLAIAVPVFLILQCKNDKLKGSYRQNFPPSLPAFLGSIAEALGIFLLSMGILMDHPDMLNSITGILGILCFPALVIAGHARWKGHRPSFLFHALVSLFFALRLFSQYRSWSSDPQLQDYCFQMFAIICLMMTAYQRTAFDLKIYNRRVYRFFSLAAVFFCCLSLNSPNSRLFFLTTAIGVYTDLCSHELPTRKADQT
jgi:hypothetical protein